MAFPIFPAPSNEFLLHANYKCNCLEDKSTLRVGLLVEFTSPQDPSRETANPPPPPAAQIAEVAPANAPSLTPAHAQPQITTTGVCAMTVATADRCKESLLTIDWLTVVV